MTPEEMLRHATEFEVARVPCRYGEPVLVRRMEQMDGSVRWAVYLGSSRPQFCLGVDLEWYMEPIPSGRTDGYLGRCRWRSLDAAWRAGVEAAARLEESKGVFKCWDWQEEPDAEDC